MVKHTIDVPIFKCEIEIVLAENLSDAREEYTPLHDISMYGAVTLIHDGAYVAVYEKPSLSAGLIAHESLHLTNLILKGIGHKGSIKDDEVQCYLMQWIIEQTNKIIEKWI